MSGVNERKQFGEEIIALARVKGEKLPTFEGGIPGRRGPCERRCSGPILSVGGGVS